MPLRKRSLYYTALRWKLVFLTATFIVFVVLYLNLYLYLNTSDKPIELDPLTHRKVEDLIKEKGKEHFLIEIPSGHPA